MKNILYLVDQEVFNQGLETPTSSVLESKQ